MPDASPPVPATTPPITPDTVGESRGIVRSPATGEKPVILFLALGVAALANALILGTSPLPLTAVVPRSPHPGGYAFFLAVLVPLFLAISSLWNILVRRAARGPLPGFALFAEWAALMLLPLIGLATLVAHTPRSLLTMQGILFLLLLLLRLAGMLVNGRRSLLKGTRPRFLITAGLPLVIYLGLFGWLGSTSTTTGDEPYYLMVARSIAKDGDVSLNNQFVPGEYESFYWRKKLAPQNMIQTKTGWKSSAYTTLFPLLLAPGSLLEARWGPTLLVILLSSLLAAQIYLLTRDLTGDDRSAFFAWASVSFTLPLLAFSSQVYPETAAALLACILLRWALAGDRESGRLRVLMGVLLPALLLPALKARYLPISLAGLAVYALRSRKARHAALLAGSVAAALAAFIALDAWMFEGALFLSRFPSLAFVFRLGKLLRFAPTAVAGILADQEFGLLLYAPLYFLVPAGIWWAARRGGARSLLLFLPILAYGAVLIGHFGHLWYGGFSQPSRYLVAVLPLAAPFLGWARKEGRGPVFQGFVLLALLWSALITIPYLLYPALRYQQADGFNNLFALLGPYRGTLLARFFPSFLNLAGWDACRIVGVALVLLVPALLLVLTRGTDDAGWARTAGAAFILAAGAAVLLRAGIHRPTGALEFKSLPQHGGRLSTSLAWGPVLLFERPGWAEADLLIREENQLLTITAGVKGSGSRPVMAATLDGRVIGRIMLLGEEDRYLRREYRFTLSAPPGRHILRLYLHFPGRPPRPSAYLDRLTLSPLG